MQTSATRNPIILISRNSSDYPTRLNDLHDPPSKIHVQGSINLLKLPMIAIVGSRNASPEGLENARLFARALSKAGLTVISGLAKGVDSAAHQAVIDLGLGHLTAAILGTGIDVIYPKQNIDLSRAISRHGLLISEFAMGAGPKTWHFPKRNRLIAALSLGVVVIEAAERSGSLITARFAADLGRDVFALPGSIRNPKSAGCHRLIQQGAKLVFTPQDVLEELHF